MTRWLAGGAAVLLIGFALWLGITSFGKARYEQGRATLAAEVNAARAEGERKALEQYKAGVEQGQAASRTFVEWREGPLRTLREEVTRETIRYGATAAGGTMCFDADGLRHLNQSLAAIAAARAPFAPGGGPVAVPDAGADRGSPGREREPGAGAGGAGGAGAGAGGMRGTPAAAGVGLAEGLN